MPLHALKRGRVLQIREDFADERENHALSVYQRRQAAHRSSIHASIRYDPALADDLWRSRNACGPQSSHGIEDKNTIGRKNILKRDGSQMDLRMGSQQMLSINTRQQATLQRRRYQPSILHDHHIVNRTFGYLPILIEKER